MLIGAYAYTCRRLFKEIDKDLLAEWDLRLACIADERDHLRSRPPVGVLEAIFAMPFPPERQFASVIRRWEWAHRHRHSHDSLPRTLSQHKQYQTGDLESDLWQQGDAVRSSRSQPCLTVVTMAGIWVWSIGCRGGGCPLLSTTWGAPGSVIPLLSR
jgi:hypothetical protein